MSNIRLQNIDKSFGDKHIIKGVTIEVKEGEMVSLLGPSGCGKTTTLKIIAGLLEPDEGDILFDGESIKSVPTQKREAVIVFQDHRLFPHMTVRGNIEFGLKVRGFSQKARRETSEEMLRLVYLEDQGEKYPEELSGGQRQRVAIARALAVRPKVLLLDEPFSNLDLRLREEMREFISQLQKRLNITTVMVTHDKSDALLTSDKIALMMDGAIKQIGSPEELYEKPNSLRVASFFGDINVFKVQPDKGGRARSEFGKFKLEGEGLKVFAFRPEDIRLSKENYDFRARVVSKKYAGDRIYYTLDSSGLEVKYVDMQKNILELQSEYAFKVDTEKILGFKSGDI